MIFADVIIGFRVLNAAHHRVMLAVFGVQRGWRSNLVTVIVFSSAVDAIRRVTAAPGAQVRKLRSSPTVVEDSMLAAAVLRSNQYGHDTSVQGHGLRCVAGSVRVVAN